MNTTSIPRRRTTRLAAFLAAATLGATALTGCLGADQQYSVDLVNQSRRAAKLRDLNADVKTSQKAQAWSERMAATNKLQHTGGPGKLDPSGIDNWCGLGENVGSGPSVQAVQNAFMASPSHAHNVLGDFDRVGTGVYKKGNTYWVTQIFVRSC